MVAMAKKTSMKLFFETSGQWAVFLMMLPVGMALGLSVDLCGYIGTARPLWDVLIVLLCFSIVGVCVVFLCNETLRMYHALAVLSGYLLYTCGIRRVISCLSKLLVTKKKDIRKEGNQ